MIDINTEEMRYSADGRFYFLADAIKPKAVCELLNSRAHRIHDLEAKVSSLESDLASARSLQKLNTAFIDEVVEQFHVPEGEMPGTYIRECLRKLSERIAELEVQVSTLSPSDPDIWKRPLSLTPVNGYIFTFRASDSRPEYAISLQCTGDSWQSFWLHPRQLADALPHMIAFVQAHKKGEEK